jgi:hypothetical protein
MRKAASNRKPHKRYAKFGVGSARLAAIIGGIVGGGKGALIVDRWRCSRRLARFTLTVTRIWFLIREPRWLFA